MNQQEVQDFATENDYDVRIIQPIHYRLLNSFGKPKLDVYFKQNKQGKIIKNSIFVWKNRIWTVAKNTFELKELLDY